MSLPNRRQNLARFIKGNDLTAQIIADRLGVSYSEVVNLVQGKRYPSPDELRSLEDIFDVYADVLLEAELMRYREATEWPPTGRGFRGPKREVTPFTVAESHERARARYVEAASK